MFVIMAAPSPADQCYDCHLAWEDESDSVSHVYEYDTHYLAGLSCSACHGGDPELEDMDEVRESPGYRGVPDALEIPEFCGSCHSDPAYMIKFNPSLPTDQLEKYRTSIHGQKLFTERDDKVANCVSCHSVHNIQNSQMPTSTVNAMNIPATCAACHADADYMKEYKIPVNQYREYSESVHGRALLIDKDPGAPACNDCHGNHGAIPPGVESISAVCGLCHALIAGKFAQSPHKEAFDEAGYPECEICHSNHLIMEPREYWIGTSDSALCVNCHSKNDGTIGLQTAGKIHSSLIELKQKYNLASAQIARADEKGMLVTDENFLLNEIEQAIIKARTTVHTFNADSVETITAPAMVKADTAYAAGLAKIDEYYFRRKGLGVASLIITILVIALYLKMRRREKASGA